SQVGVPSVAVHQRDAFDRLGHQHVDGQGAQSSQMGRLAVELLPRLVGTADLLRLPFSPHTVDRELDVFGEFARQVLDVHSGTAVNLGWILAGEQPDLESVFGHELVSLVARRSRGQAPTPCRSPRYRCGTRYTHA